MPMKTWEVRFREHTIRVVNTWFRGAWLIVDGETRDVHRGLFALDPNQPMLRATFEGLEGGKHEVCVYLQAILFVRAKICVDGRYVGGDRIGRSEKAQSAGIWPGVDDDC